MAHKYVWTSGRGSTGGPLDDPVASSCLIEEHERLMLQFMSTPSRDPSDTISVGSNHVVHGHTAFEATLASKENNIVYPLPPGETHVDPPKPPEKEDQTSRAPPNAPTNTSPATSHSKTRAPTSLRKIATVTSASRTTTEKTTTSKTSTSGTSPLQTRQQSTLPPHSRSLRTSMSSSEYQESSSPSESSGSGPGSRSNSRTPRRSVRSRNTPVTYDLRQLSGLDQDGNEILSDSPNPSVSQASVSSRVSSEPPGVTLPAPSKRLNVPRLLWNREISGRDKQNCIRSTVSSDLKPWKSWKTASGDVRSLAWSPDGTKFAAGSTTLSDQYNLNKNLLFGDLTLNNLYEVPDHWVPRQTQEPGTDDRLFTTVSTVRWAGDRLFTASYDKTVKIWDIEHGKRPSCHQTLRHDSEVVDMALSAFHPNLIAAGDNSLGERTFRVWDIRDDQNPPSYTALPINHRPRSGFDLVPTNLAWGHTAHTSQYLIGGMSERKQKKDDEDDDKDAYRVPHGGFLGMWRMEQASMTPIKLSPDSQNVFDIKWHPCLPRFAAATTPVAHGSLKTHSVLTIFDLASDKFKPRLSFNCKARDINEATFCPTHSTYLTASCTNGITYVWDSRKPAKPVHKLRHGESLQPLDHRYSRELTDGGVNVALWGTTIDQFYTGGSDGQFKQWDIRRAPEDSLVNTTLSLNEGIVGGAFSEDNSHLALGILGGGIRVLSSGPCADPDLTEFIEINPDDAELTADKTEDPEPESGITLANQLLSSGQLEMHSIYGPGQGRSYEGPFASWARDVRPDASLEEIRQAPLLQQYQNLQFAGPPIQDRPGLDESERRLMTQHHNLAYAHSAPFREKRKREKKARKEKKDKKRKRESSAVGSSATPAPTKKKKSKKPKSRSTVTTHHGHEFIDLT